ncbi:MAG: RpiB/LacA/LacB family sugar-phosphate isomerase [Luteitalea sp.]|nr:RpiB/LacA/LacB family sugar-phosphate isomerase [Luteitalea sp.]
MKRFEIITEADARMLEMGGTVELVAGGHITPLARDTLRARRVTVVSADAREEAARAFAPPAELRTLVVASDHTGIELRAQLVRHLRRRGLAVRETGAESRDPVDYPDVAAEAARMVARGEVEGGIVVDGAGLGSAIAANKIPGVRAAACHTPTLARYAREHNGVNVITLGATLLTADEAIVIVEAWLAARMTEPRYIRRLTKIHALEVGNNQ